MTKGNGNGASRPGAGGPKRAAARALSAWRRAISLIERYLAPAALLWARLHIALVFWRSGQTKISNLDTAAQLFEWEYLPKWRENGKSVLGLDLSWTVPDPEIAAKLSAFAELGFPVLLALGLGARLGALGLLGMTAVIEVFVYPGTTEHYHWMTILLLLLAVGPGKASVDHFLWLKFTQEDNPSAAAPHKCSKPPE